MDIDREKIIRYSGFVLLVSPILNFFLSASASGVFNHLSLGLLFHFIRSLPLSLWAIWLLTSFVGFQMYRQGSKAWKITLIFLGITIIVGLTTRLQHLSQSIIYIILFILIALDQIQGPKEQQFSIEIDPGIPIQFEGYGTFADAKIFTQDGIQLLAHPSATLPPDLETRTVEITFTPQLILKAKYLRHENLNYFFSFIEMTPLKKTLLRLWASRKSK